MSLFLFFFFIYFFFFPSVIISSLFDALVALLKQKRKIKKEKEKKKNKRENSHYKLHNPTGTRMALSGKRSRSNLEESGEKYATKRRSFVAIAATDSRRTSMPRANFLLTKDSDAVASSDSDDCDGNDYGSRNDITTTAVATDSDSDFTGSSKDRARPLVHFRTGLSVGPKLFEAVTRYSDSEDSGLNDTAATSPVPSTAGYILERRKSFPPKHSSFSSVARKQLVAKSDTHARKRCFDYLLQSIDEVWSRYCNTTSTAETEVYDSLQKGSKARHSSISANSHLNSYISSMSSYPRTSSFTSTTYSGGEQENEDDDGAYADDDDVQDSDDASGYKSEATNPTEYETDCDCRKVSNLPASVRLQSLKDRLTRAKNDLEDIYDSFDFDDCAKFWRRWDMIKYGAVEMMEEDDDDDVIESVIEELEEGRCYTN